MSSKEDWDDWDETPAKPVKNGRFKTWEDEIIKSHWQTHTDEEVAEKLNRNPKGIERRRKVLGLIKKNGRPAAKSRQDSILTNPTEYNLSKLSKEDRIEFYKAKFDQNPRYGMLLRILMTGELNYYKRKYIEVLDSLDSVTMNEEDLIHNMIMKEISIVRIQMKIKQDEENWQEADDDNKPSVNYGLYRDMNDAEKQFISYQEKLRLTREQRLKIDKEEKVTVTSIVRSFLDKKNKHRAGTMAGQMQYGADKCRDEMNKMNFLLGG